MKPYHFFHHLLLASAAGLALAGPHVALASTNAFSQANANQSNQFRDPLTLSQVEVLQSSGWSNNVMSGFNTDFHQLESSVDSVYGLQETLLQPQYVEARINHNGAALTGDVLPQVVSALGYDEFTIPDQQLASGTLPSGVTLALACHNSSAVWNLKMNDIEVTLPLDANSLIAHFTDTGRINSDMDLDGLSLEFELQFYYPYNVGGFYCNTLGMGSNYNFRVNVNVDGASGELDVQADAVSGRPVVNAIKKFSIDVDSVSFDSSFLTSLTNIGIGISNLFGSGCSTLTQCVNNALDDQLTSNAVIQNKLKDAINAAIDRTLSIEGGFNIGATQVDYSVGLEDVTGSNALDRLTSVWDVSFDSDQADDPCADGLLQTTFFPGNSITTGDDFELVVPFKKVTDLLYTLGKKGVLCASAVVPGTVFGSASASVAPTGHVDLISVADDVLELTVPMSASVSALNAVGTIDADLVLEAQITPACGSGLSLKIRNVDFENVAGSIEWSVLGHPMTLDATGFVTGLANNLADDIQNALDDDHALLPESFGLQDITRYVATGDVVSNNSAIAVGPNVVNVDPNCN